MGDDIGLGSICLIFAIVQLTAAEYVVYDRLTTIDDSLSLNPNWWHQPLISQLRKYDIFLKWEDDENKLWDFASFKSGLPDSLKFSIMSWLLQSQIDMSWNQE